MDELNNNEVENFDEDLSNIIILNDENGRPYVQILNKDIVIDNIDISISHCKDYATASVVVTKGTELMVKK